jgi:O-antigen ligase
MPTEAIMAATAPNLRHHGDANYSWVAMALAMLALALGCGYTLALGEMAGLYVGLSLVCAVAVLFDFRAGAVLLLLLLPASASALFPRGLMQVSGLNPLNLLVMATLGSYVIRGRLQPAGPMVPQPLVWLYIVPIAVAAVMGVFHVGAIPSFFYEMEAISFFTEREYLLVMLVKPFVIVAVALLIGAAAARSQKPERFIIAIAGAACLIALIQIGFVISQGASLAAMATTEARGFYEPLGMHANSLGRVHLFAVALLLFVWAETRRPGLRLFLLLSLGLVGIALLLTFSRAAIGGAVLVGMLFIVWKFNAKTLALALVGLTLVALFAADVLYSRLTMGFDQGANAVSAGRIEGIWLPLLPEVARSPVWGNGLGSTLWSYPMLHDAMLRVGHPHNAYLEAVLDMGFLGLALLLAYYAHVWKGFRALGSNAWLTPELRSLFQGATAALAVFLVTGLTGSSLRPEPESAFLWIAIGLMYGLRGRRPAS